MSTDRQAACAAPFREAAARLGVEAGADARTLKRAYRKATAAHPPDRDPEGFRKIRDAYELLSRPGPRVEDIVHRTTPWTPPPRVCEGEPMDDRTLANALLRAWATRLDPHDGLERSK